MLGIIDVVLEYLDLLPNGISAPMCPVKRIGILLSPIITDSFGLFKWCAENPKKKVLTKPNKTR